MVVTQISILLLPAQEPVLPVTLVLHHFVLVVRMDIISEVINAMHAQQVAKLVMVVLQVLVQDVMMEHIFQGPPVQVAEIVPLVQVHQSVSHAHQPDIFPQQILANYVTHHVLHAVGLA